MYKNNKLYCENGQGISIFEVRKCLSIPANKDVFDANYINKWAKHKPVVYKVSNDSEINPALNSDKTYVKDVWKAYHGNIGNCGWEFPMKSQLVPSLFDYYTKNLNDYNGWKYHVPTGNLNYITEWKRLLDFNGYNHLAKAPIQNQFMQDIIIAVNPDDYNDSFNPAFISPGYEVVNDSNISLCEIDELKNRYFGLYLIKSSDKGASNPGVIFKTCDKPYISPRIDSSGQEIPGQFVINNFVSINYKETNKFTDKSNYTDWECFPILTSTPVTLKEGLNQKAVPHGGNAISYPFANSFKVSFVESKYVISITERYWMPGGLIGNEKASVNWKIEIINHTTKPMNFTKDITGDHRIYVSLRKYGKGWDEPLTNAENLTFRPYNVHGTDNGFILPAGKTKTIKGSIMVMPGKQYDEFFPHGTATCEFYAQWGTKWREHVPIMNSSPGGGEELRPVVPPIN